MGINPSIKLAECEAFMEEYQAWMTELENEMDILISGGTDDPMIRDMVAVVRTEITTVRAAIGFWRGEASFWRNEINENKIALKDSNKLASSS